MANRDYLVAFSAPAENFPAHHRAWLGSKLFGALPATIVAIAAVAGAVVAQPRAAGWNPDETVRRLIFADVASEEPAMRRRAARNFAGDPWSADDDFHNAELRLGAAVARRHGAGVPDALRAIDEGLRSRWSHRGSAPLEVSVPPCHPRPDY